MLLLRTRSAIRTHTVRALNAVPPAVGLPGHAVDVVRPLWTTSVSNRAGAVCKTALHTCASPERASEEARTPSSGLRIRSRPAGPHQRAARAAHVGACGETRSAIRASAGVRSPLR